MPIRLALLRANNASSRNRLIAACFAVGAVPVLTASHAAVMRTRELVP
jgi:hypothetical protein